MLMKSAIVAIWLFLASTFAFGQTPVSSLPPIDPLPDVVGEFVGTLESSFEVDSSGAANYKIPLAMPPGTGGLVPKLELQYRSNQGDGLLGIGWSLIGLSAVSICPTSWAHDGYVQVANFDIKDRFCIDGQRLRLISGGYGPSSINGAEFRTSVETGTKVTAQGVLGNGPRSFTAYLKNGLIYEYGATDDSRLEAQGRGSALSWQVNKISDRSGNYLTITYSKDAPAGEILPLRIDYTGNGGAGLSPYNSVRFSYEPRSVPLISYVAGALISNKSRIKSIAMYAEDITAWTYKLSYQNGKVTKNDRITQVQECDQYGYCIGNTMLWGAEPENILDFFEPKRFTQLGAQSRATWNTRNSYVEQVEPILTGDWNGDGRSDVARVLGRQIISYVRSGEELIPYSTITLSTNYRDTNSTPIFVGDWNGDGRSDIGIYAMGEGAIFKFWASNGNGFGLFGDLSIHNFRNATTTPILTGDWNGDGKTDILCLTATRATPYFYSSTEQRFTAGQEISVVGGTESAGQTLSVVGDWNGDGLSDFGYTSINGSFYFYRSTLEGFIPHATVTYADAYSDPLISPFVTGDWNGDGLTDFARISTSGIVLYDSTGVTFTNRRVIQDLSQAQGYTNTIYYPLLVGDWNADGTTDIARVTNTKIRFYHMKAGGALAPIDRTDFGRNSGFPNSYEYPMYVGDWNGDGFTDIGRVDIYGLVFQNSVPSQTNAMVRIVDSIGKWTGIEYATLNSLSTSVYSKGSGSVYPLVDILGSAPVVASVSSSNGLGGSSKIRYQYTGLRYDLLSKAMIGFTRLSAIDETHGTTTLSFFSDDASFRGAPTVTEQRQTATGVLISRKEDTWAKKEISTDSSFSYISGSTETIYDIAGVATKSSATALEYDNYGNPTQQKVTYNDGAKETTVNTYSNDSTKWIIGQLTKVEVTKVGSATSSVPLTRTSAFVYEPTSGKLSSETIEPNDPLAITKAYTFDTFGNTIKTVVSGYGISPTIFISKYDSKGRFVIQETNPIGQSVYRSFDARHGTPYIEYGLNDRVTQWVRDGFGHLWYSIASDGVPTRTIRNKPPAGSLSNAAYYIRTDQSGTAYVATYYDELNRPIRKETINAEGKKIFVDTVYDERGNLVLLSEPYFNGEVPLWNAFEYDILGRVVKATTPGGRITSTSYSGLTNTVTNPIGQKLSETVNPRGQVISTVNNNGNPLSLAYDSFGNLTEINDLKGNITTIQYDKRGNKTKIIDPDSGATSHTYDALGRNLTSTNSLGQVVQNTYDLLGRVVRRVTSEGTSTWTYDTALHGAGKLHSVSGPNGYIEINSYDANTRLSQVERRIDGLSYKNLTSYDQYSRPSVLTYPDGYAVQNIYASDGSLKSVLRVSDNQILWTSLAKNARGQFITQRFGNGIQSQATYDPNTGLVSTIKTGAAQNLSFTFDKIGNLTQRQDLLVSRTENFSYDNLNRLIKSEVLGQSPVHASYDEIGNIIYRSDVGSYYYEENGAGPHAVSRIVGLKPNVYQYDQAGNRISSSQGTIAYNSFGKPTAIAQGNNLIRLTLDSNGDRFQEKLFVSGILKQEKIKIGSLYEKVTKFSPTTAPIVQHLHYIVGGDGLFAAVTLQPGVNSKTRYLHKDHLGSIQTITNEMGNVTEVLSFDSWGLRRNPVTWAPGIPAASSEIDRGFTGHEQLDEVGLIHMNGRVYDPVIGRFVSPDPFVNSVTNLQSLNRYTYVDNNPLSFTDPSGYFLKKLFKSITNFIKQALPIVITIAVAYVTNGILSTALMSVPSYVPQMVVVGIQASGVGIATSVASTVTNGGSIGDGFKAGIKGAPMSALRAIVSFGIGEGFDTALDGSKTGVLAKAFGDYSSQAKIVAHGLAAGALGRLEGHDFIEGLTSGVAGEIGGSRGFWAGSLAGGTAAALTGGKFKDGAMQGAYQYLYNRMMHSGPTNTVHGWLEALGASVSEPGAALGLGLGRIKNGLTAIGEFESKYELEIKGGQVAFSTFMNSAAIATGFPGFAALATFSELAMIAIFPESFVSDMGKFTAGYFANKVLPGLGSESLDVMKDGAVGLGMAPLDVLKWGQDYDEKTRNK